MADFTTTVPLGSPMPIIDRPELVSIVAQSTTRRGVTVAIVPLPGYAVRLKERAPSGRISLTVVRLVVA